MNENKNTKVIYIITIFCFLVSIVIDVLVKSQTIKPILLVSNDYLSSVFSGILTFSALSQTVLSIIASVVDTKVYGLKLREILSFGASPIKFIHYIILSMLLTLSAIAALAFELYSLITTIAFITIIFTNGVSILIFKIVLNVDFCKKIVFSEITDNSVHLSNYILNWMNEYKTAIEKNNSIEIKMYAEVLKKCAKQTETIFTEKVFEELFFVACKNHTVADAIYLVFNSIGLSSSIDKICTKSIKTIAYYNELEILEFNIPNAIDSIVNSEHLYCSDKVKLSHSYFEAIIYSKIDSNTKLELLKETLNKITKIPEDEVGCVRSDLIYTIVLNNIIFSDEKINKYIYEELIKSIYCNNLSSKNSLFIKTIGRIIRCFYFYSVLSVKIFNEKKRNQIATFAKSNIKLDWLSSISLRDWSKYFRQELLIFYLQDSFETEDISTNNLDNNVTIIENDEHHMIWQSDNKLKFAFWFYFAFISYKKEFPIYECTKSINKWCN